MCVCVCVCVCVCLLVKDIGFIILHDDWCRSLEFFKKAKYLKKKYGVECLIIIDLIPIVIYVRVYVSVYVRVYVSVYVRVPCMWVFMYKREQLNFYDPILE